MAIYSVSFLTGLVFALGLSISGMTQPSKVVGFLNVFGAWDVTLAFVMVGAILVHSCSYFFIKKQKSPLLESNFHLPSKKKVESKLIVGAILFGAGWALAGLCPGPALVSLATGSTKIIAFICAMTIGTQLSKKVSAYF